MPRHIPGLDTLRFFAAWWVFMSHGAAPPLSFGHNPDSFWAWALNGFYGGFFNGQAAVILFFVISGFCIHYPYATGKAFLVKEFYVRRFVRIALPMFAAIVLARLSGMAKGLDPLAGIPAWSLVPEMIYYLLYPILRRLAARFGWRNLFIVSFIVGFFFAFTSPAGYINYPYWGYGGDWVLGLPCWLIGVLLANRKDFETATAPSRKAIWCFRLGIMLVGAVLHNIALQGILGQQYMLNFFAVLAYWWLWAEIRYNLKNAPPRWGEWMGLSSYSLYLVHILGMHLFYRLGLPNFGAGFNWILLTAFVFGLTLAFYFAVERPSHRLARTAGQRFKTKTLALDPS